MMEYQTNKPENSSNETIVFSTADTARRKIKTRLWKRDRVISWGIVLLLFSITVYTLINMDYGSTVLFDAVRQFFSSIFQVFARPQLSGRVAFSVLLQALSVTIALSVLTTIISSFVAFFFSLFVARNLGNGLFSQGIRMFMSFIRAVPTILWVMIFSILIGLGSNAAVIGMTFHGVAYLTKVYAESIEEIDEGVIEALRACGGSWWHIVFQAVFPSCLTAILSWTFLRFEINFANAVAVGAAAGAGGLGFQLVMASGFYFDFRELGVIVYLILAIVLLLEIISLKLKKKYLVKT